MTPDPELLRRYVDGRDEAAFAELVRRHLTLVHTTALRLANGDAALAEDVTQSVFTDLARKAPTLCAYATVAGWLHISARYAAAKAVRGEQRRRTHEQEARAMSDQYFSDEDSSWAQMRPLLDEAVSRLHESERDAVLLRFFQDKNYREVGRILGVSEDAARMRVERALDNLRGQFARRGVVTTAALIGSAIGAQAATAMPSGFAAVVAGKSLAASRGVMAGTGLGKSPVMKILAAMAGLTALAVGVVVMVNFEKSKPPAIPPAVAVAPANPAPPPTAANLPANGGDVIGPVAAMTATVAPAAMAAQSGAMNQAVSQPNGPQANPQGETAPSAANASDTNQPALQNSNPQTAPAPDRASPRKTAVGIAYTLTNLGTPSGDSSEANAINSSGQIVGWFGNADPTTHHAFLYNQGVMQDLGTAGRESSEALAINSSGLVVGRTDSSAEEGQGHGFSTNSKGQVIQFSNYNTKINTRAFLFRDGKMQDLGTIGGPKSASWASAINDAGQIAGTFTQKVNVVVPAGPAMVVARHAFLYSNGKIKDLGQGLAEATGINSSGLLVGSALLNLSGHIIGTEPGGGSLQWQTVLTGPIPPEENKPGASEYHAARYKAGLVQQLDTLGGSGSLALAVNSGGQIAGWAAIHAGRGSNGRMIGDYQHAVLFSDATRLKDLGTLGGNYSMAFAINGLGQIVGFAAADRSQPDEMNQRNYLGQRAFLYRDWKMQDLNLLVGESALAAVGFRVLLCATGINASGQIVGYGEDLEGRHKAFLLTPATGR